MDKPFTDLLACPYCKNSITENSDSQLICSEHGIIGEIKFGIYDFLFNQESLSLAAGGIFDLAEDEKTAREIYKNLSEFNFRELQEVLAKRDTDKAQKGNIQARAVERYNKNYAKMEAEIGLNAGHSIMNKVNPYLTEKGLNPLGGNLALEAGGGQGLHLPSFAKYFEKVVFADCSLVNLIMGKKLAQETGVEDQVFLVRGDATLLPFKDKTFDFVHEAGVIEHVKEPQNLVSEALRVLSDKGNYVCLSPNKYPLSPEPHFNLPLFGAFPPILRKHIILATRGLDSEEGTDLLSLGELKRLFRTAGEKDVDVYFLPRKLPATTRSSFIRRFIHKGFHLPVIGGMVNVILNKLLLSVMPYHIVVISRDQKE